jgi:hypothetical protein
MTCLVNSRNDSAARNYGFDIPNPVVRYSDTLGQTSFLGLFHSFPRANEVVVLERIVYEEEVNVACAVMSARWQDG